MSFANGISLTELPGNNAYQNVVLAIALGMRNHRHLKILTERIDFLVMCKFSGGGRLPLCKKYLQWKINLPNGPCFDLSL